MTDAKLTIVAELERFLRAKCLRQVYFAEDGAVPPTLAYLTHFPRLSVVLDGCHPTELVQGGSVTILRLSRGQALFVPANAWNKPEWSAPVLVMTFLFGARQIGISLVRHDGQTGDPTDALKTTLHGSYDRLTHGILNALCALAAEGPQDPLHRLLTESLLRACLRLLQASSPERPRKAVRTYEDICLYVQENFQSPLTREGVAHTFGLAPNHVSRLFRQEGFVRFNDYLNLVRVSRAKYFLRKFGMPLKEVAASCGYPAPAYFCRVFKKITRLTPTEYRQGAR
jgi:AraC-like DNA-binding protein